MDPRITTAARLQQNKQYPQAEQIYRTILRSQPRNIDALLLLGLLLHETKRHEESVQTLRAALKVDPHRPMVHQTIIDPLLALGRLPEAIVEARELVRLQPMVAEIHQLAARLLLQGGDFVGALPYARRAVELKPAPGLIQLTLVKCLQANKQTQQALAAVDRALQFEPNNSDLLFEAAMLRYAQGEADQAIAYFEAVLRLAPTNIAALNNLGNCYLLRERHIDAIRCYEAAATLSPTAHQTRSNIGVVYKELGRIDDALPQFHQAAKIDPSYAIAWCNIGSCHATLAQPREAIAAYREALRIKPDFDEVRSNLLMELLSPVDISREQVFAEHREFDRAHCLGLPAIAPPNPGLPTDRKIRIGYVSPDFREHSIRYFMQPILANHDRSQFEITCYAAGKRRDGVTTLLSQMVDAWHFVADLTHAQLAQLIHSHGIDILVDLAGHTADNRLLTFAHQPAPVQVTYLGYPTTTGLSTIDFRLTDSICDPPGADEFYTEALVRLPVAFFAYGDDLAAPLDLNLPADRNGYFTFGSFNSFTKINDETLDSWATILKGVPNSRLLMKARPLENPSTRRHVIESFAQRGIPVDRLDLRAWVTLPEHTALLGSAIDLMLDTYPYNGHTTSCQALWRGVPVVTRSGNTFRSRVGECILNNLGLPELVAHSKEQYEQIAIRTALDLAKLRELRATLGQRMRSSPLANSPAFTRALEDCYRKMLTGQAKAAALVEQAMALHRRGELPLAMEKYEQAGKLDPQNAAAWSNLGAAHLGLGQIEKAIEYLGKATQISSTEARTWSNLGIAHEKLGKFDQAIVYYEKAIALDPDFWEARSNLGGAYSSAGQHDKAIASYRETLNLKIKALKPDAAELAKMERELLAGIGGAYDAMGRHDLAIANFRQVVSAEPGQHVAHSNLLMSMLWSADIPESEIFAEHQRWGSIYATPPAKPPHFQGYDFSPNRRLRIGYVSPDFREHSVRHFIEPILASHDKSKVEVFCYFLSQADAATQRLKTLVEHWRSVPTIGEEKLAERIREDRIDVLIDLAGHTSEYALLAFARSPAPVQVTYLGYPATTGVPAIQYRLTDSITDPPGTESYCTETLHRLPNAFFVFGYDPALPYDAVLPADRNGYVTFGSFNAFAKVSQAMLDTWAQILRATPNSRLLFKAGPMNNPTTRKEIETFFADRGIDPQRLMPTPWVDQAEHYRLLGSVDLALDPFPYHGHTTTCQQIWMGVPMITRVGDTFRSRVGATILHHLDLMDFAADSNAQYAEKAIAFANDLTRLRELRPGLRERMRLSPLCDAVGFTRDLEEAYRQMFSSVEAGKLSTFNVQRSTSK
jgi:predicted O-linked N-acetylglucosamine transferase (SPINDLY family)